MANKFVTELAYAPLLHGLVRIGYRRVVPAGMERKPLFSGSRSLEHAVNHDTEQEHNELFRVMIPKMLRGNLERSAALP
jgi:hypothetical protein